MLSHYPEGSCCFAIIDGKYRYSDALKWIVQAKNAHHNITVDLYPSGDNTLIFVYSTPPAALCDSRMRRLFLSKKHR